VAKHLDTDEFALGTAYLLVLYGLVDGCHLLEVKFTGEHYHICKAGIELERFGIAYYPHVSIGWDNNPRFKSFHPDIVTNNTPENFKKALLLAKDFCDKHCKTPLISVNSWNEWTETSYLEPDDVNGYGYLDAIKEVFLG
jgi:hypothetical protein